MVRVINKNVIKCNGVIFLASDTSLLREDIHLYKGLYKGLFEDASKLEGAKYYLVTRLGCLNINFLQIHSKEDVLKACNGIFSKLDRNLIEKYL